MGSSGSKFFHGASLLLGDATVPGVQMPDELRNLLPTIFQEVKEFGCDYYPTVVQMLTYDEISEIAAYGGFPVRFPHWKWGMEYEELQRGYEHGMHRIYEMVVNCLSLNTAVLTGRGTIPAEQIVAGDVVFGASGSRKVAKVERQKSSSLRTIKIKGYGHDIVCTPNHKWMVMTDDGPQWVEAKNLSKDDLLIGQDNYSFYQNNPAKIEFNGQDVIEQTAANVRWCLNDVTTPSHMTLDFAELLGALLGDGSVGVKSRENALTVVVDHHEEAYRLRVARLFNSVFGASPIFEPKGSVVCVTLCSKKAVAYLSAAGVPTGCTFETNRIPSSIWNSSQEFRAAFLRGLFDTDGCASDSLTFSAYNRDLAADVQLMLAEMGIRSDLATRDNGEGQISTLRIEGRESLFRFRDRINFSIIRKSVGLSNLTDTASCVGGGPSVEFLRKEIIKLGDGITTYSDPSIGRSLSLIRSNSSVGYNALYGFIMRAIAAGHEQFTQLYKYASMTFMEVAGNECSGEGPTVDIALFHSDHDFVANGLLSHNTNPCYIYCLDSNTLVDNVTVVAHALFHCDFFKTNIFFGPTSQNMMNELANHGTRIRKYMRRWGKERVTAFIDNILRIETLIDPSKAWDKKQVKDVVIRDTRTYKHPNRLNVKDDHDHMEKYINPKEWTDRQRERLGRAETAKELDIFSEPTKDIMGFLRDNAPLKPWQADIIAMLYEESMYFAPQRATKMLNEGWASFGDYKMMCDRGLCGLGQKTDDSGIIEYAAHKMGVLGGKYSMNPYKLGYCLLLDIEERWNKGRFGDEYDRCTDLKERENWDKNLGLGKEKVFQVRRDYNDVLALSEFFTEDFCNKYEFFEWKRYPNGEYKIENRDFKSIKAKLIDRYSNGGLPEIRLTEPNYRGKGEMFIQHTWNGRPIHEPYVRAVMQSLYSLWSNDVHIATCDNDGNEIVYTQYGPEETDFLISSREDHEKE